MENHESYEIPKLERYNIAEAMRSSYSNFSYQAYNPLETVQAPMYKL